MFRSIRWKFIIIYFLLVFIAMIISGVFIIRYFEQYQLDNVAAQLQDLSEKILLPQLSELESLENQGNAVRDVIRQNQVVGFQEEVYVISGVDNRIIAASTDNVGISALDALGAGYSLIAQSLNGSTVRQRIQTDVLTTMDMAMPILHKGQQTGVLYLRYDLRETYRTLDRSKIIILQATMLALLITVLLGYVIAKSVTEPINAVTEKAAKMARGDFDQAVDVRSDDEIGKLAEMFNHLTSKLKSTLGEISQEKGKLEAILACMADGLVAVDQSGAILHINPKARDFFGLDDFSPVDKSYDELMTAIMPELTVSAVSSHYEDWTGSNTVKSGDSVYAVSFAPFRNDGGDKIGLVFLFQDITEQHRLEQMRREFVANVSHELKTPLTSIKSYTETLLDGAVDQPDTARHFLKVVDHEADRMTRLVRDLLQLSNFDANTIQLEREYHDYADLMRKTLRKLEVTAKNKGQTLSIERAPDELVGYFDFDRIEQVVQNIVSNALKYTPEGGTIQVSVYQEADTAVLEVRDNGVGIPEKDISRIFDRFYRVDKARSRNLGGTGLGLSIAQEIVHAHEGDIQIFSELNKGTFVKIVLPLSSHIVTGF